MNTSLLLCFAVAVGCASAVSVPLRQNPETICIGQENFLRIASEDSCLHYYQCYADRAYLMQCPIATWFNENEQICDSTDPPVGCTVELEPKPVPEPEPDPETEPEEETEESEEETEESEETTEETDIDSIEDGSGDLEITLRNHQKGKGSSTELKEVALENELIKLFKTFLINLQKKNDVNLEDEEFKIFEETFVNVIRNYRNEESNGNDGVVKFKNAYQIYKQHATQENDVKYLELEDEDFIHINDKSFGQKLQAAKAEDYDDSNNDDMYKDENEGDAEERRETEGNNSVDGNTDEDNEGDEPSGENEGQENVESAANQESNAEEKAKGTKMFNWFLPIRA